MAAQCLTEDDNALERCIQEIVYTPDFDQIFSDKNQNNNTSASGLTTTTTTTTTNHSNNTASGGAKRDEMFRPPSSTADPITPASPLNLNPSNSPATSIHSMPCSYSTATTGTSNVGPLQNIVETLTTPQSSPQTYNSNIINNQQHHQQSQSRVRINLLPNQQQLVTYQQQQPQHPPPTPQQQPLPCCQQQPPSPPILLPPHSPHRLQAQPAHGSLNRYDPNSTLDNVNFNNQQTLPIYMMRPLLQQQQQQSQQQQTQQLQQPSQLQQHLQWPPPQATMQHQQLANSIRQVISLNYPIQAPISRHQQNVVTQSTVSNAYRATTNNAQQVVNMLSTIQSQTEQQQQQQLLEQQIQSSRFPNTSLSINNQPAGQYQQQQMASTPIYTNIQQPNTSCQTLAQQNNPLPQRMNSVDVNTNSQRNSFVNNSHLRPRAFRAGRPKNCYNYTSTGQRINRDYSRQPNLSQTQHNNRNAELSTQDPTILNNDATNIPQRSASGTDPTGFNSSSTTGTNVPNGNQPPVSVSSTTQPTNVSPMQSVEVQAKPETFNRACQVDPRPKSMISRALNATVAMEDAICQTDGEELGYIIVPRRTYVDRACSPIVALVLQDDPESKPVSENSFPPKPPKGMFRTKQTVKRRKIEPQPSDNSDETKKSTEEDDIVIDVVE